MSITLPYRILAVDPATTKSGWSVLDVLSLDPLKIQIVAHGQVDGDKLLRDKKEMAAVFSAQFCKLDALFDMYEKLIKGYDPDQVVSEGAFGFNHMSALIGLTLAIDALRRASKKLLNKDVSIVPPTISKLAFTGKGGADKDHMRLAYQTNSYLIDTVSDDKISEHEIDAIAHGCAFVFRDILGTVTQISAKDKKAAKQARKEKALAKKEIISKGEA